MIRCLPVGPAKTSPWRKWGSWHSSGRNSRECLSRFSLCVENKAQTETAQGEKALLLQLRDRRGHHGKPPEDDLPEWFSGHVWLVLGRQVHPGQGGEWACAAAWLDFIHGDILVLQRWLHVCFRCLDQLWGTQDHRGTPNMWKAQMTWR